ncbi:MAG: HD-GYP domain-containing protein [Defluviitaleaceae bacterium]|nr:HD-GYP domain-containing protein [Defluviitaleaceae bacterium]
MFVSKINLSEAEVGMKLAESVYFPTNTGQFMLVARKLAALDEKTINMLRHHDIQEIEVYAKTRPTTTDIDDIKKEEHVPIKTIIEEKLKVEAVENVKQLFNSVTPDGNLNKTTAYQCVKNIEGVVGDLLNVISNDAGEIFHIYDLKAYDEYTYHHSLSVSVLSMATGRALGMDDEMVLRLGSAAMLHDIGKQMIPPEIINKKGKLTDPEFNLVKNHPSRGADSLRDNGVGDEELWGAIRHHHEKIDGSGYPNKLSGEEIPLFSRIIAVADVYDAITSYRSYRSPMPPLDAFNVIFEDINTSFDYNITKAFYEKLEFYPINSIVELNDGKIAIVVQASNWKLRPIVRLWGSDEIVVLSSHKSLGIKRIINATELPEGYEFV